MHQLALERHISPSILLCLDASLIDSRHPELARAQRDLIPTPLTITRLATLTKLTLMRRGLPIIKWRPFHVDSSPLLKTVGNPTDVCLRVDVYLAERVAGLAALVEDHGIIRIPWVAPDPNGHFAATPGRFGAFSIDTDEVRHYAGFVRVVKVLVCVLFMEACFADVTADLVLDGAME